MNLTVAIPDSLADRLGPPAELERRMLEALAAEEYRAARISHAEMRQLLRLQDDRQVDAVLEAHGIPATQAFGDAVPAEALVASFRAFAALHSLGGLSAGDLIAEGRR